MEFGLALVRLHLGNVSSLGSFSLHGGFGEAGKLDLLMVLHSSDATFNNVDVESHAGAGTLIRQALAEQRREDAERGAHTLKGVAAQIGATALSVRAELLERALHETAPANDLAVLLEELDQGLSPLVLALGQALAASPAAAAATAAGPRADAQWPDVRQRLRTLLAEDDAASLDLFLHHEAQARAALGPAFGGLAAAIRAFDFGRALQLLDAAG